MKGWQLMFIEPLLLKPIGFSCRERAGWFELRDPAIVALIHLGVPVRFGHRRISDGKWFAISKVDRFKHRFQVEEFEL